MDGIPAQYMGRVISKEHFRAYIYKADGSQKLVNSWYEFEKNIETGVWFVSKEEALASLNVKDAPEKQKKSYELKRDKGK
jgi:hypothetical protein